MAVDARRIAGVWAIHRNFLMAECCRLVENILEEIERLERFKTKISPDLKDEPRPNIDLQRAVSTMVTDISKLSNILTLPKQTKASKKYAGVSEARVGMFSTIFAGLLLEEIKQLDARHSIEHFEERIDEAIHEELIESAFLTFDDPGRVYFYRLHSDDVTSTGKHVWAGQKCFVRVLNFNDMTFWNFEGKVRINQIKSEVISMREKLIEHLGVKGYKEMSTIGMIMVVGKPDIKEK